jgi:hypothetical protein
MSFFLTTADFAASAEKVAKLNARAIKAGIPAKVELVEIARHEREAAGISGFTRRWTEVEFEIAGLNAVKFNGWTLAATLDHGAEGNIFRVSPHFSETLPVEFRNTDSTRCDHCGIRRQRNLTVVVYSETEGFRQVGSDCVKLFLGVSPTSILSFMKDVEDLADDDILGGGYGPKVTLVSEFVAAAALATEVYGFRPASFDSMSTRNAVEAILKGDRWAKDNYPEAFDVDAKMIARANDLAAAAVEWIKSEQGSDYITNLRIAVARNEVGRNAGLLASLPNAYKRAMAIVAEREARAAVPASEHVGTVGAKVTTTCKVVYTNRTAAYSYYGPEGLFVILLADDGTKFYLNTTVDTAVGQAFEDASKDTKFTVTGTVKGHKVTDKGEKVTVLTRCKAQEV